MQKYVHCIVLCSLRTSNFYNRVYIKICILGVEQSSENKHSDACNYLLPYKFDVLKIVEYKFSCEMEAHVQVTTSKRHFNV